MVSLAHPVNSKAPIGSQFKASILLGNIHQKAEEYKYKEKMMQTYVFLAVQCHIVRKTLLFRELPPFPPHKDIIGIILKIGTKSNIYRRYPFFCSRNKYCYSLQDQYSLPANYNVKGNPGTTQLQFLSFFCAAVPCSIARTIFTTEILNHSTIITSFYCMVLKQICCKSILPAFDTLL